MHDWNYVVQLQDVGAGKSRAKTTNDSSSGQGA